MREINFRAWDTWHNKYFENAEDVFISANGRIAMYTDTGAPDYGGFDEYQKRFLLEQYTGLKDKNGAEIYEGDIICQQMRFVETNGVIFWQEDKARFAVNLDGFITTITKPQEHSYEVIGNIHENADLLEEQS